MSLSLAIPPRSFEDTACDRHCDSRRLPGVVGNRVTPRTCLRDNANVPEDPDSHYSRIYAVVRRIPRGRVATYAQVARLAGLAGHARQVGYALHALATERPVPWHRVINARGEVSPRSDPGSDLAQREFLEREGVVFDLRGRVDLARFQWRPRNRPVGSGP
jgi:methylated-DNA-protein-cysteine methyltransferase-like protein